MKRIVLGLLISWCTMHAHHPATIDYLKNHPQHVELCARWSFETWGHYTPERPLEDFIASRKQYLNDDKLPLTYLALVDQKPVGMCSLAVNRGLFPELTPWLATLYVEPEYSKQGIGTMLEKATCDKARSMGYKMIYLFTSEANLVPWYEKLNWKVRCVAEIHNHQVTVMEKKLDN